MRYGFYEDGRPASRKGFPYLKGTLWEEHTFDTLKKAQVYAVSWLNEYAPQEPLQPGVPFKVYGIPFEIREET